VITVMKANDILHDEFEWDDVLFVDGCRKLVAHEIGQDLADGAVARSHRPGANQRPVEIKVVARMFKHGQAEAQASLPDVSRPRQPPLLPFDKLAAKMFEAAPSQIILVAVVRVECRPAHLAASQMSSTVIAS